MVYKYNFQKYDKETMGKAVGTNMPISMKHSVEVSKRIRGKTVARAKDILQKVIDEKVPVKYTKYNRDLAHKKGMGSGRFPVKTAQYILQVVKSAEKNAEQKGIKNPIVVHISANKASQQWHHGRKRRRKMKNAHVEVVVAAGEKKEAKKQEAKPESKSNESKTDKKHTSEVKK